MKMRLGDTMMSCSRFSTEREKDDEWWKWKRRKRSMKKICEGDIVGMLRWLSEED